VEGRDGKLPQAPETGVRSAFAIGFGSRVPAVTITSYKPTSRYQSGQLPVTEKPELARTGEKSEKTIALGLRPTAYPLGDSLK
jgi:hypothetical protein